MLRRQLTEYDRIYECYEREWCESPNFNMAFEMLKWCKRIRDMFGSPDTNHLDERLVFEPMVCRVDVVSHVETWTIRVRIWRERFNLLHLPDGATS